VREIFQPFILIAHFVEIIAQTKQSAVLNWNFCQARSDKQPEDKKTESIKVDPWQRRNGPHVWFWTTEGADLAKVTLVWSWW
jgi:hypothetical protein